MPLTYAIADLHGRFDLLEMAYAAISSHSKEPGTIVHLGDYVDRGPSSRQIIEELQDQFAWEGWRRIVLKGNHEDIMWQACVRPALVGWWIQNGGGRTLMSYGQTPTEVANVLVVPIKHVRWLDELPLMHVDKHRVYVHAGVNPDVSLDENADQMDRNGNLSILWKLYDEWDQRGHGDRHVVHGHHQYEDGPLKFNGRTNLDTFAWYTGRLVVGCFDDEKPGGAIDFLEVKGPPGHVKG